VSATQERPGAIGRLGCRRSRASAVNFCLRKPGQSATARCWNQFSALAEYGHMLPPSSAPDMQGHPALVFRPKRSTRSGLEPGGARSDNPSAPCVYAPTWLGKSPLISGRMINNPGLAVVTNQPAFAGEPRGGRKRKKKKKPQSARPPRRSPRGFLRKRVSRSRGASLPVETLLPPARNREHRIRCAW
jgi:hypothetical protein